LDQVVSACKPLCLALNKSDLFDSELECRRRINAVQTRVPFLKSAPIICTSAKTGSRVLNVLEKAAELARRSFIRISSKEAQHILERVKADPRAPVGVRHAHLFRIYQVGAAPVTFHLLARVKRGWKQSDMTYLEGVFRRELRLEGVPFRIRLLARPERRMR